MLKNAPPKPTAKPNTVLHPLVDFPYQDRGSLYTAPSPPQPTPAPLVKSSPVRITTTSSTKQLFTPADVGKVKIAPSNDVHAWSAPMRELIKSDYEGLPDTCTAYASYFDESKTEIIEYYKNDAVVNGVLGKMASRKNVIDADLCGISPAGLLSLVWIEYVKKNKNPEFYMLFSQTLYDMGLHCVQGDTHRLFSILVAMDRSSVGDDAKK
jgi:hypothetical protein